MKDLKDYLSKSNSEECLKGGNFIDQQNIDCLPSVSSYNLGESKKILANNNAFEKNKKRRGRKPRSKSTLTLNKLADDVKLPKEGRTHKLPNKKVKLQVNNEEIISLDSGPTRIDGVDNSSNNTIEVCEQTIEYNNDRTLNTTNDIIQPRKIEGTKLNAFQFMMDSRNKVIGTNSPGKDVTEVDVIETNVRERKDVLNARKNLLKQWSDAKGDKQRKLREHEVDKCIKHKLKKREKRLKKLLKVEENPQTSKQKHLKKRKKIVNFITDSESGDNFESESHEISSVKRTKPKSCKAILEIHAGKCKRQSSLDKFGIAKDNALIIKKNSEGQQIMDETIGNHKNMKHLKTKKKNFETNAQDSKIAKSERKLRKVKLRSEEAFSPSNSLKTWKIKLSKSSNCEYDSLEQNKPIGSKIITDEKEGSENLISTSNDVGNISKCAEKEVEISSQKENHLNLETSEHNEQKNKQKKRKRVKDINEGVQENDTDREVILLDNEDVAALKLDVSTRVLRTRLSRNIPKDFLEFSSSEDSDPPPKKSKHVEKKNYKVAPVFAKAIPKPKMDPEVIEARKRFLLSGIPDVLKKEIIKQECLSSQEFDVFPEVNHVQQKSPNYEYWNLPNTSLHLKPNSPKKCPSNELPFTSLTQSNALDPCVINCNNVKIRNMKKIIRNMKLQNPHYQIYKSYRLIFEKSGKKDKCSTPNQKKRRKKSFSSESMDNPMNYVMWTEKYKPKQSGDIIGNLKAVTQLKNWLKIWSELSTYCNTTKKRKRLRSSDSDDFITSDGDSIYSTNCPASTVILEGPCGSGKTAAVYAISNELGMNVLEINASSKRTGKRLLQEMQEATQSHQVHNNEGLFQMGKNHVESSNQNSETENKMCVILIEDIDIVFDQDEGLMNALSQLVTTTKRPIILTTTDKSSVHLERFVNQFESIRFSTFSAKTLSNWLQIVCLVEGCFLDAQSIGELLEFNRGDVRQTLLHLQYWVLSGGQIDRNKALMKNSFKVNDVENQIMLEDEACDMSLNEQIKTIEDVPIHTNCVRTFEIFHHHKSFTFPLRPRLDKVWWNLPILLRSLPSIWEARSERNKSQTMRGNSCGEIAAKCGMSSKDVKQQMRLLSNLYDSLTLTDVSYKKSNYGCDREICTKRWSLKVRDSTVLSDNVEDYSENSSVMFDWTHFLVDGNMRRCIENDSLSDIQRSVNMAVPGGDEISWLTKKRRYEETFVDILSLSSQLDRKSLSVDYLPTLRHIARSERYRSEHNTKRNNRFYNYLKTLDIKYTEPVIDIACNVLC